MYCINIKGVLHTFFIILNIKYLNIFNLSRKIKIKFFNKRRKMMFKKTSNDLLNKLLYEKNKQKEMWIDSIIQDIKQIVKYRVWREEDYNFFYNLLNEEIYFGYVSKKASSELSKYYIKKKLPKFQIYEISMIINNAANYAQRDMKSNGGSWECPKCHILNRSEIDICIRCGHYRSYRTSFKPSNIRPSSPNLGNLESDNRRYAAYKRSKLD